VNAKPELVSVVIPTYNYGHFVCDAVDSALRQTYPNVEVIVVDDGSTDDTAHRLAKYSGRIHYVHQANSGLSAARNTGIRAAEGEWIALLDSDDVWHADKTSVQLEAARNVGDPALVGSTPSAELPKALDRPAGTRVLSVRDFLMSSRTGPSGTLIRRACFERVGLFDETLTSVEDRDMWLRVAARYQSVQVLSPCWWYRPHQGQMSRKAARMLANYEKVLTKFFLAHPEFAPLERLGWSYLYLDGAWAFLEEGEHRTARRLLLKSFQLWPSPLRDEGLRRWPRARTLARLALGETLFQAFQAARKIGSFSE
jgi:Glycosyltransferases involved in cell wall biogenesis